MKLGKKPKQSDLLDALGSEVTVQYEEAAPYVPEPAPEPETPDTDVLDKVDQQRSVRCASPYLTPALNSD